MNYQSSSSRQGAWFEATCRQILEAAGFAVDAVHQRIEDAGVEVDLIGTNRHEISFFFTCKGSYRGRRPGVRRTDTLKKAIAEAYALHQQGWEPVVLLTSHLPNTAGGRALLASVDPAVLFDAIELPTNAARIEWLARSSEEELRRDLAGRRSLFNAGKPARGYAAWPQPRSRGQAAQPPAAAIGAAALTSGVPTDAES